MKMVDISRKTYEINVMETKIDNDGVLQLNVKHIEEGLDLRQIKTNYNSNHRKHRCDLVEKPKKKVNRILSYRMDLYFYEINENGHIDRNIDYEIKRQKEIEQELGCKFIKIDPDKEDFDIFKAVNEIFRHIKQST